MNRQERHKLKRFINELKSIRGRHTELISVYIPAGYDIIKIIQHLEQEQGTASNIKDKNNRKNVIDSIERMIRYLRLYKQTPPNGLVIFAGDASDNPSKIDIKVWSIEPAQPVSVRLYRCDHEFKLDELEKMLDINEVYGLVVMDKRDCCVGLLKGTAIILIKETHSNVPGKFKAGGQSANRLARLREEAAKEFYDRIGEIVNQEFLPLTYLKGIFVGGPGMTKDTFVAGHYINQQLKDKIVAIKDLSYTGEYGLKELVEKSAAELSQQELVKEKEIVNQFLGMLAKNSNKVSYGKKDVKDALIMGAVEKILISEDFAELEEYENLADTQGTEVFIISTETDEGIQIKNLGGVVAILRYEIKA